MNLRHTIASRIFFSSNEPEQKDKTNNEGKTTVGDQKNESDEEYVRKLQSFIQSAGENIKNGNYLKAEEQLLDVDYMLRTYSYLTSHAEKIRPMLNKNLSFLGTIYLKDKMTSRSQAYRLLSKVTCPEGLPSLDRFLYFYNLFSCLVEKLDYVGCQAALQNACELLKNKHPDIKLKTGVQQLYTATLLFVGRICEDAAFLSRDDRKKQLAYVLRILNYLKPAWVDRYMDSPYPFLYLLSLTRCYSGIEQFAKAKQCLRDAIFYLKKKTHDHDMYVRCRGQVEKVRAEILVRELERNSITTQSKRSMP